MTKWHRNYFVAIYKIIELNTVSDISSMIEYIRVSVTIWWECNAWKIQEK